MKVAADERTKQSLLNSFGNLISVSNLTLYAYVSVQVTLLLSHESWRDEVSPWIQTQDSSWAEVFYKSQLELQSPFFFTVLKLLHFVSDDFWTYRVFLFLLSVSSAFIIKSLCNNSWKLQILIFSNYYIIYEYSTIQRIYTVSLFFLVVFMFCLKKNLSQGRYISTITKISLLLLNIVSIWTLILSLVILLTLIFRKVTPILTRFVLTHLILTFAQLIFLLISKDREWGVTGDNSRNLVNLDSFALIFTAPIRSLIFIPDSSINGWNTNILYQNSIGFAITLLSAFSFYILLLLYIFRKNYIGVLWFLSISTLAILVGLGKQRHLGQIFLLIATILFLEVIVCKRKVNLFPMKSRVSSGIFLTLLLISAVASPISILRDVKYEFTTSRSLFTYIEDDDLLIVQDSGKNTHLPLVLKLNKEVFNIFGGGYSRESLLNRSSRSIPNNMELARKFQDVCSQTDPSRVLFYTDFETRKYFQDFTGKLLFRSHYAIVENEGKRELWLLAESASGVKKLCSDARSGQFLSKIRTKPVIYGR